MSLLGMWNIVAAQLDLASRMPFGCSPAQNFFLLKKFSVAIDVTYPGLQVNSFGLKFDGHGAGS